MKNEMTIRELSNYFDETERIAGGAATDFLLMQKLILNKKSKVLVISNVETAVHFAHVLGCSVDLVDADEKKCSNFDNFIISEHLESNIAILNIDIEKKVLKRDYYDAVICGNIFSVLKEKKQAATNIVNSLKKYGRMVITQFFSFDMEFTLDDIKRIDYKKSELEWLQFYEQFELDMIYKKEYKFLELSEKEVDDWLEKLYGRKSVSGMYLEEYKNLYNTKVHEMAKDISNIHYYMLIYIKRNSDREPYLFKTVEMN